MKTSPTQRSLKQLREQGFFCAITERWNSYAKVRQDLFGFVDVLGFRGDIVVAVQTTSGSNVSARLDKIREIPAAKLWLASPNRKLVIHGWAKRGARGERKLWNCREVELCLAGENIELREVESATPYALKG